MRKIYSKSKQEKLEERKKICIQQWKESELFIGRSNALELINSVMTLTKEYQEVKSQLDSKREELKELMYTKNCYKVVSLKYGKSASISQGGTNYSTVFNEEKFKEEHPDLYKEYCNTTRGYSYGGRFYIRKISNSDKEIYKDVSESMQHLIQKDLETILHFEELKKKFNIGNLMTMDQYVEDVRNGCITEYDGFGFYVDAQGNNTLSNASTSIRELIKLQHTYPYVLWFNR